LLAVKCTELLAVPRSDSPAGTARASAEQLAAAVPAEQWITCSAKGRRLYDWVRVDLVAPAAVGMARWLLVRRSRSDGELAVYVCYGPAATPLIGLVRVAGTRWTVEEGLSRPRGRSAWTTTRSASGRAGTDTSRWRCWRTRSWQSPAPMPPAGRAARQRGRGSLSGGLDLLPLTVSEVRRLLVALVWTKPVEPGFVLAWAWWRRRHQARARRVHYQRQQKQLRLG
jgi:hypothetical protein